MAQAFTCSWELLKLLDECQRTRSGVFMPTYHGQVPDFVPYFQQLLQAWRLGSWGSISCVKLVGHQTETPQEGRKVGFGNGTFGRWDGYGWWSFWQMFVVNWSAYVDIIWYPCAMFGILKQHPCNRCDWSCRFCLDQSPTRQRLTVEFCPFKMLREVTWVAKVAKMCSQPSSVPLSFQDATE